MARSAAFAVALVVLLLLAGATPAASDATQPNGEWASGPKTAANPVNETTTAAETTTEMGGKTTTAETTAKIGDEATTAETSDGATTDEQNDATTDEQNEATGETIDIETEGFDPDYDPAEVLRRVEALRNLSAVENVTLHEYDEAADATHDVRDRFAAIRPTGARTLQLYSNASTEQRQAFGYTVQREQVHVYLMNDSDVTQYGLTQEAVLAHEFVHALQFQHDLLTPSREGFQSEFPRWTTDSRLVTTALVEGDAMWVTQQYLDRYGQGNYSVADYNRTLARAAWPHSVAGLPYYYGYQFYAETGSSPEDRTAALTRPPNSTAELLHPGESTRLVPLPEAPAERPLGDDQLSLFHADAVGELVVRHAFRLNGFSFDRSAEIVEGWANDRMYYFAGEAENGPATHWVTVWENASEAREFADGWRSMLRANGAESVGDTLHVPASDETPPVYYVVEQEGDTVRITAAPNAELADRLAGAV
jgi:hypothetical protein